MASKPANLNEVLSGPALLDASSQMAQTPKGGIESGFDGTSGSSKKNGTQPQAEPAGEFQGLGSWLEGDDETVFETVHNLVLRQELIAQNHLAQDIHYTRVKLGYPFSTLEKDPNKDTYRSTLPAGTKALTIQAVPNQAWDLVNKATEAIMVDPPQPDPSPVNNSEKASSAAEIAERFLTEDAGENGTNDIALFFEAIDRALTCATSYIECWTDPVGGGYVPLQINAHPTAQDPANPLIGADGSTTPDPILRYVTKPEGGQFTTDPSQAAPQWQPKIRGTVWGREHWRVYPESATVNNAKKAIGLLYCTLGEAKDRWPEVAAMSQSDLDALLSWQPPRFMVLLPPYQRARWKISAGSDKEKSGSSDERIMFYYRLLQKATPDHPRGAEVIVTGALDKKILFKTPLAAVLNVPVDDGTGPKKEVRCMDIPLVQVTPRGDPDDKDPTGRCFMELFVGGTEFNAALATGFLEALDQWLHPDTYIPSTSTVQGFQRDESRATGDMIPILGPNDKPIYGQQPPLPAFFWDSINWNDEHIRSISSLTKPLTGDDKQQEVSGVARKIAVQQGQVGLSRMTSPANSSHERWWRLKLQAAQRDFTTPQVIRYEGEDGAFKEEQWRGVDFAQVGNVGVQSGTGTMLPPEQKVNYLATLMQEQFLPPEEAADAARQTFAQRLGLPDNPYEQAIERSITLFLKGPPQGWVQTYQQYTIAMQQYQAEQQAMAPQIQSQQEQQARQQMELANHGTIHAATAQNDLTKQAADHAHGLSLAVEDQKHRHVMEQKQADAEIAKAQAPPPAPPPEPPQASPELVQILNAHHQLLTHLATKEPAPINVAPPDFSAMPATTVNVQSPDITVQAAPAPNVTVTSPNITVESSAPDVNVQSPPAVVKKGRRKGKIKAPDGKTYTFESTDDPKESD